MSLEQKLNKGFDTHDALLVGAGAAIGGLLTGGVGGVAFGALTGYVASQLADYKSYYK